MPQQIRNRTGKVLGTTLAPRSRRSSSGNIQSLWAGAPSLNPTPTVEYLIVAGGGSGGTGYGAAGGAGGYRTNGSFAVTGGVATTVTVGSGGAAQGNVNSPGNQGLDSAFSTITSAGGGRGGGLGGAGASGGSGGGGAGNAPPSAGGAGGAGNTPSVSPSQGTSGQSSAGFGNAGGYGGGIGGVATGAANSITGSSVTYAVGGSNGGAGADNTGNGGGQDGPAGGSGIVVIKYADTYDAATTTGSPVVTVAGGYRVYKFTGSGTITF